MRRAILLILMTGLGTVPAFAQPPSLVQFSPVPTPSAAPGPVAPPGKTEVPQPSPREENLANFDPQAVRLTWVTSRWQLQVDGKVLKDFGHRQAEARQALRLIQDLRLSQRGTIGSPAPVMEYWLADGQAPQGLAGGLRVLPLVQAGLRVEQVQGQWCLRDPQRVLFSFGSSADDARQALDVVRKYGFTQIGIIGTGTASMMVFMTRPGMVASTHAPSGRQLTVPHIPHAPRAQGNAGAPVAAQPTSPQGLPKLDGLVAPAVPRLVSSDGPEVGKQPTWRAGPQPSQQASAERTPFDWRQVQLRQEDGGWKLMAGSLVLADFGTNQFDARMALAVMRYYRFTEQWRMGSDFTYFLANGQTPRGVMLGVPAQVFTPTNLTVRQVGPGYALCAGEQVLVGVGNHTEEARRLAEVLKQNQIDRLCQLGNNGQGMTFLLRSR